GRLWKKLLPAESKKPDIGSGNARKKARPFGLKRPAGMILLAKGWQVEGLDGLTQLAGSLTIRVRLSCGTKFGLPESISLKSPCRILKVGTRIAVLSVARCFTHSWPHNQKSLVRSLLKPVPGIMTGPLAL